MNKVEVTVCGKGTEEGRVGEGKGNVDGKGERQWNFNLWRGATIL